MVIRANFVDVDVIHLHYVHQLGLSAPKVSLRETSILDNHVLKKVLRTRFENTQLQKMLCGQHRWYFHRMRSFLSPKSNKKLRVYHWSFQSSNKLLFMLNGRLYPNITYTYDSISEHWFYARVRKSDCQVTMKCESKDSTTESPLMHVFEKFRSPRVYSFDDFTEELERAYSSAIRRPQERHKSFKDEKFGIRRKKSQSLYLTFHRQHLKLKKKNDPNLL